MEEKCINGQITIKDTKDFTANQLKTLYASVGWVSADYSKRLVESFHNTHNVISAWDQDRLVGLIEVLADGELTAYIHYLLIHPDYQGMGIGKVLVQKVKDIYKDYLYLLVMCEETKNIGFYENLGFEVDKVTPLSIKNFSGKD